MSAPSRVLSLALLIAVVAVSSALAGRNDSSFTVTSSLDGKTVLPLRSHWIAYPKIDPSQGQVAEVDYLIDGYHAWTAHNAPWYYGDKGNWLVTSVLKPGLHTFTVRALTADDQVAIDKFRARVTAPRRPPAKLAGSWSRAGHTLWPSSAPCRDRAPFRAPRTAGSSAPTRRSTSSTCRTATWSSAR